MARYDFPDEAWALISPMLPPERGSSRGGRPYFAHRHVMNGIFWVLCSGALWRDLPERYGQWKTIYNRFNRWSKAGIMNSIFNKLLPILDEKALIDWDVIALDSGNVRALKAVLADKGYSSNSLRIHLKIKGIKLVIPFKSNEKASQDRHRPLDRYLYKKHNVVKRCFAILKENRRIATRSEKTARNYLSMLKLGAIRLFLKRLLS
ncbi:IS5 family transposase [Dickeya dianthicola]|uniref:IS5 family transposase n=1 Tax=Dickeya dianthicola TaxID=204039 RepID=UPI00136D2144|nr:IS5 family transposase [Dickeya dianthicola]MZG44024.1 IS5 family transposase [Dickeya dianthicola]